MPRDSLTIPIVGLSRGHLDPRGRSEIEMVTMTDYIKPQLARPEARAFADLFEDAAEFERGNVRPTPPAGFEPFAFTFPDYLGSMGRKRVKNGHAEIGTFCSMRDGRSMWVKPRAEIIDYIREYMVFGDGERISFEIVVRDDGALVIARNSQIIGSRWLALIDPATIPTFGG